MFDVEYIEINYISLPNPKIMRLLFVCVGNSCRSQMAEGIAKSMGHEASSAGTHPAKKILDQK